MDKPAALTRLTHPGFVGGAKDSPRGIGRPARISPHAQVPRRRRPRLGRYFEISMTVARSSGSGNDLLSDATVAARHPRLPATASSRGPHDDRTRSPDQRRGDDRGRTDPACPAVGNAFTSTKTPGRMWIGLEADLRRGPATTTRSRPPKRSPPKPWPRIRPCNRERTEAVGVSTQPGGASRPAGRFLRLSTV